MINFDEEERKARQKMRSAQGRNGGGRDPRDADGCCENVGSRAQALLDKVPPCTGRLFTQIPFYMGHREWPGTFGKCSNVTERKLDSERRLYMTRLLRVQVGYFVKYHFIWGGRNGQGPSESVVMSLSECWVHSAGST